MTSFDQEIDETVTMVWSTMLELPLHRTPATAGRGADVAGVISLDGGFDGAVLVQCSTRLAQRIAGLMFDVADPADDDVRDAIGETTNMVAGNLKVVLPNPCHLGLPVVAFGSDYQLNVLGTEKAGVVSYESEGEPFVVTLLRQSDRTEPQA